MIDDQYAYWNCDGFGAVVARQRIGSPDIAVVSVQFTPNRRTSWVRKIPEPPYARYPLPRPIKTKELELA